MKKLAIIAIGYNRPDSMNRLLSSLNLSYYAGDKVDLIISIDNGGCDALNKLAQDFEWKYGKKILNFRKERLGLRKHILSCGDYLSIYDAVAVLEDDLVVSPSFYAYMKSSVDYYYDDDRIAGISLYKHLMNTNCNIPFEPQVKNYDTYFMQFAMSWGQIWLKRQWFEFKHWYQTNNDIASDDIPQTVLNWNEKSWLKYHIAYCVLNNKYFVYPYLPMTTCYSDVGEHSKHKNCQYQIPLFMDIKTEYRFAPLNDEAVCYDSFYERVINESELTVDIYGTKKRYKRYLLTTKGMPYKVIHSYGLDYRPVELNYIMNNPGNDLFLYDTSIGNNTVKVKKYSLIEYEYRINTPIKSLINYTVYATIDRIKEKM